MPSAVAGTALPILDENRRSHLLARSSELHSGREKPGRYWRIDLDAIAVDEHAAAAYTPARIQAGSIRGGFALDILTAAKEHPQLFARAFGAAVPQEERKFAALATALCNTGAFVYVPAGVAVDEAIEITYRAETGSLFPYTLVLIENGARCTVIERIEGGANAFVCGASEIVTGESSNVTFVADQALPEDARVFFTRVARPGKDATVTWCVAELGAGLSVDSIDTIVENPGIEANINALFFPRNDQHVDMASTVSHDAGSSQSHTLVKSAATDRGQARYLGNIRIAKHAQATEASLRDDALLLSKKAHIDSIPALEIAANDVKAFHGATVGALDEDAIFYMTTRGIARDEAEQMIALGFFEPVLERFPGNALRDRLRAALQAKITR